MLGVTSRCKSTFSRHLHVLVLANISLPPWSSLGVTMTRRRGRAAPSLLIQENDAKRSAPMNVGMSRRVPGAYGEVPSYGGESVGAERHLRGSSGKLLALEVRIPGQKSQVTSPKSFNRSENTVSFSSFLGWSCSRHVPRGLRQELCQVETGQTPPGVSTEGHVWSFHTNKL